jgi:hypothetical protein
MTSQFLMCRTCFSQVTPAFIEEQDPGITYGLPTKEAFDDPDFRSGGCLIPMPDYYQCDECDRKLEFSEVIFV